LGHRSKIDHAAAYPVMPPTSSLSVRQVQQADGGNWQASVGDSTARRWRRGYETGVSTFLTFNNCQRSISSQFSRSVLWPIQSGRSVSSPSRPRRQR
jgi:hypothetical protein